jgi:hypothetical protein
VSGISGGVMFLFLLLMVMVITILLGDIGLCDGRGMLRSWEGREIHREFWLEIIKGRVSCEDISVDRRIILQHKLVI